MIDPILMSKTRCNGDKYFSIFEKHLPDLKPGSDICMYDISNELCIMHIIDRYPNCNYYISDIPEIITSFKILRPELKLNLVEDKNKRFDITMKFDCIIMNPPYDGNKNLYGRLTLEAKNHAKEVVCLSPYLNYLNNSQKKSNHEVASKLMPFLNSYTLIDPNTFDACFDKKLCIFHFIDNPINHPDVNEIYWNEFSNPILAKSIITKMTNYSEHCYSHIINKNEFDNYSLKVAFSGIRGHRYGGIPGWDWTTILDEEKMVNFTLNSNSQGDLMGFPFSSEDECKHFVKYINSDIFEYMILVQKNSMNTDKWLFKLIPYMSTYEKEWTDQEIADEIGLTDEELSYIYDEMKNYGWKTRR